MASLSDRVRQHRSMRKWISALVSLAILVVSAEVLAAQGICPLAAGTPAASNKPAASAPEDGSCLVHARSIGTNGPIYDIRGRAEYLSFHIPNAQHSTAAELSRILRGSQQPVIVYDSGKFRSDAFQLCARLRAGGFQNFKIIDGGIAAWAQVNRHPERLGVSRLSDTEVSAALFDPANSAVASTEDFKSVLSEHGIKQRGARTSGRRILVGDTAVPSSRIGTLLDSGGTTAFYWSGGRDQLTALIHVHLAQDQKRVAGPVQSAACSAL